MMELFNKEQVLEAYVEEERRAAAKAAAQGMKEDIIAKAVNVSIELVRQ